MRKRVRPRERNREDTKREKGERSGVVEKRPESKNRASSPGWPVEQRTSAPSRAMLEPRLIVRQSFFWSEWHAGPTGLKGRKGQKHTRVPRAYICRRGGEISQDDGERGTREEERWRWLKRGPVSWVLYKLPRVDGDGEPRGSTSKSLFSGSARSAI